jgi:hypothetical protein
VGFEALLLDSRSQFPRSAALGEREGSRWSSGASSNQICKVGLSDSELLKFGRMAGFAGCLALFQGTRWLVVESLILGGHGWSRMAFPFAYIFSTIVQPATLSWRWVDVLDCRL